MTESFRACSMVQILKRTYEFILGRNFRNVYVSFKMSNLSEWGKDGEEGGVETEVAHHGHANWTSRC